MPTGLELCPPLTPEFLSLTSSASIDKRRLLLPGYTNQKEHEFREASPPAGSKLLPPINYLLSSQRHPSFQYWQLESKDLR